MKFFDAREVMVRSSTTYILRLRIAERLWHLVCKALQTKLVLDLVKNPSYPVLGAEALRLQSFANLLQGMNTDWYVFHWAPYFVYLVWINDRGFNTERNKSC